MEQRSKRTPVKGLGALLEAARNAGPLDRIEYRDSIAAYGGDIVPKMATWLRDPALGVFAVRVLQRVALVPEDVPVVVAALKAAAPEAGSEAIALDIAETLKTLTKRRPARGVAAPHPAATTGLH